LRRLEEEFADALIVVGVHSGKYTEERLTPQIRLAAQRLGVRHPVVNDRQFRVWRRYGVFAWPTLVFIDPSGRYLASHAGEASYDGLRQAVAGLVADGERRGDLVRDATPGLAMRDSAKRGEEEAPRGPLRFPTGLAGQGNVVAVADTGHNRVLLGRWDGSRAALMVDHVAGSGEAGAAEGPFHLARFNAPHGVLLDGMTLYVADTANHRVRAADLEARVVRTVAGTGRRMGTGYRGELPAREADLASPWNLARHQGTLFVAMAGSHQLWTYHHTTETAAHFAGTGVEAIDDGVLAGATLAQPAALAVLGDRLYFADSESNAIRWADLSTGLRERQVHTVVGTGLFDFGDRDGVGTEVRLQHPTGLAVHRGRLYVADTYNHRLKLVVADERRVMSVTNGEEAGGFNEPEGLLSQGADLLVADTNHHRLVALSLSEDGSRVVSSREVTVELAGSAGGA
jgi:hypothetical protein